MYRLLTYAGRQNNCRHLCKNHITSFTSQRKQVLQSSSVQSKARRMLSMMTQGGPGGPTDASVAAAATAAQQTNQNDQNSNNNPGSKRILGTILFGIMSITTFGLGMWQTDRYQWKVKVMEDTKKRMEEEPVEWRHVLKSDKEALHGRKIVVRGKFDHAKEVLLGPRPPPVGVFGPAAQGLATNPSGYYVLTPFHAEDGRVLLVNRGWVGRNTTSWSHPTSTNNNNVELLVIMSEMEREGRFSPVNDVVNKKLLWLEEASIMKVMGWDQLPADERPNIVVEAIVDDIANPDSLKSLVYPVPKVLSKAHEQYVGPPTHIAYATTWFSLSIAAIVFGLRLRRKGRPSVNDSRGSTVKSARKQI